MSAPIEPRVRYQAQFWHPKIGGWWDAGISEKRATDAREHFRGMDYAPLKTRIVKQTTTSEIVEEMEQKQ